MSAQAQRDDVSINISVPDVSVTSDVGGNTTFFGKDIQFLSKSGEPAIPYFVVRVLLPPDADLTTVSASLHQPELAAIPSRGEVPPMPPLATWDGKQVLQAWPSGKTIVNGRDADIYSYDGPFPSDLIHRTTTGQSRESKLAEVVVAAYQYNPVTKTLWRLVQATLVVNFGRRPPARSNATDTPDGRTIASLSANLDAIASPVSVSTASSGEEPKSGYVIITTNAVKFSLARLDAFIQSKRERGFDAHVITEDVWGGGTGDVAAENIRRWLRSNYLSRNIRYVLLIGDPNPTFGDVPMKMLWPRNNYPQYRNSPSDYFYADLTGNWDLDGDTFYGEGDDDFGPGGVDRYWDVLVGRIPNYSTLQASSLSASVISDDRCPPLLTARSDLQGGDVGTIDRILDKSIAYESERTVAWRQSVLLAMEPSDAFTPGYHLGEAIKNNIIVPRKGWRFHRVYNENYGLVPPPETVPTTVENVTRAWNASLLGPFGAVFWWTHGSSRVAADIMDLPHASTLDDSRPAFTFQASCDNSYPEDRSNLSFTLLGNGAIGTVGATRVSWYYPGQTSFAGSNSNSGMVYEYANRLIGNAMESGLALYDLKQTLFVSDSTLWMNYTVFNLYGDPSLGLFTSAAIAGDLTSDGALDVQDYLVLINALDTREGHPGYIPAADYDGDKHITYADYRLWYELYKASLTQ